MSRHEPVAKRAARNGGKGAQNEWQKIHQAREASAVHGMAKREPGSNAANNKGGHHSYGADGVAGDLDGEIDGTHIGYTSLGRVSGTTIITTQNI